MQKTMNEISETCWLEGSRRSLAKSAKLRTAWIAMGAVCASVALGCSETYAANEGTEDGPPLVIRDIEDIRDQVIVEDDVGVIVRDGTRLSAKVFRPVAEGQYPVIMMLTAYGKDRGPDQYPRAIEFGERPDFDSGTIEVSEWTSWEAPDPATWVPSGYAVVYLDVRGYLASEGEAGVLSPEDGEDFYDAIEWAGAQEWSNGNVGLLGVSYLAISQWVAATANPPSLKAIAPWEGQTDAVREVLYHGGVPETAFVEFWIGRVNSLANTPPLPADILLTLHPNMPELLPFLPTVGIALDQVTAPALICASWSDHGLHTRGSFEAYKQIPSEQKWIYNHGRAKWDVFYSDDAIAAQKQFFDHFLKGEDNGMDEVRSIRLEVRESLDEYQVRYEDEWPISRTEYEELYLDAASGALREDLPADTVVAEYAPLEGAATFTITFDEDTELTGNMKLKLWVSANEGTDMDLFVGVEKLDTNGEAVHFRGKAGFAETPAALGWLRVSERALDESRSTPQQPWLSHDNPQPLTPNEIVPVEVEILPSSTLFRAGESLQVIVQGQDLFEHPSLAHDHSDDVNRGTHSIHTGGQYDSHLLAPVVR
ncbi:MAG: CocE/NonD family hydrolase [Deltaproteobacteria bacterium]|nr:MAG: CocE/NonD family hydrolase [Deltaproteobacteria bacterium]